MDAATLEALRGSIAKWEGIVAGTTEDLGPQNCPLCIKFRNGKSTHVKCDGCPVRERTGRNGCSESPYDDYEKYFEDVELGDVDFEEVVARSLAKDELDFLKSLLPKEQFKDAGDCPVRSVEIQGADDGHDGVNKHVGELWLGAEWLTVQQARALRDWLNEVIP